MQRFLRRFDREAAKVVETLEVVDEAGGAIEVSYLCLERSEDAAVTAQISGQSVWPAAVTLARFVAAEWSELPTWSAVEVGCGCGVVGLACGALGCPRVAFTDRDAGALDLAARGAALNGFPACAVSTARLQWGPDASIDGERFGLVLGSDLIYDPGVVGPLVEAMEALLDAGGCVLLAQSFALGDESSAALTDACERVGLRLETVSRDGDAALWRAVRRDRVSAVVARSAAFSLAPRGCLVCWRGVLALAFRGWPRPAARLKRALDDAHGDALPPENPGSRWPKVSLAAPVAGAAPLSSADYAALAALLDETRFRDDATWRVAALRATLFARASHERLLDDARLPLAPPGDDAATVSHAASAFVDDVFDEARDADAYVDKANLAGGDVGDYRALKRGASLVAFLCDGAPPALFAALADLRARVDARFPGRYAWFADDALHCTLRSLA